MNIGLVSFSYEDTPVKEREKVSFKPSLYKKGYKYLLNSSNIKEAVILSTCNRTEIYFIFENDFEETLTEINILFLKLFAIESDFIDRYLKIKRGFKIVDYLFQLASGLKSQVIGEQQILGQIKNAHNRALEFGASAKYLNKIFRQAVTTGKKVRHKTGLSSKSVSLSSMAVKYIEDNFSDLKNKKLLIIGVGKMSRIVIDLLHERGVEDIFATNRTHGKVVNISENYKNLSVINYSELHETAVQVDIIISSTAAPHYVLHYDQFIEKYYKNCNICLIDLGVPRDIEPRIGDLEGLNLYNIDQLTDKVEANREFRKGEINKARGIIEKEFELLKKWEQHQKIVPIIKDIKKNNHRIVEKELEKFLSQSDFNSECRQELLNFAEHLSNKLYNRVILNLKKTAIERDQEIIDIIRNVFSQEL